VVRGEAPVERLDISVVVLLEGEDLLSEAVEVSEASGCGACAGSRRSGPLRLPALTDRVIIPRFPGMAREELWPGDGVRTGHDLVLRNSLLRVRALF
jgi:hypothetical protein